MKLRTFLDQLPHGGIAEFAGKIEKSPIYLSQLAAEQDDRVPSAELCVVIEDKSGHAVTRQELRPKDFWKIWPDLAHLAPTQQGDTAVQKITKPTVDDALEDAAQPVLIVSGDRRHGSSLPDPDIDRRATKPTQKA